MSGVDFHAEQSPFKYVASCSPCPPLSAWKFQLVIPNSGRLISCSFSFSSPSSPVVSRQRMDHSPRRGIGNLIHLMVRGTNTTDSNYSTVLIKCPSVASQGAVRHIGQNRNGARRLLSPVHHWEQGTSGLFVQEHTPFGATPVSSSGCGLLGCGVQTVSFM